MSADIIAWADLDRLVDRMRAQLGGRIIVLPEIKIAIGEAPGRHCPDHRVSIVLSIPEGIMADATATPLQDMKIVPLVFVPAKALSPTMVALVDRREAAAAAAKGAGAGA